MNTNDPGIARRVYFVQRLHMHVSKRCEEGGKDVLGDDGCFREDGEED